MKQYCISPEISILECLKVIDSCATGIAIAVDKNFKLIGTISDGDIRRALIGGAKLNTTVNKFINRNCFSVLWSVSRAEVLDIMQARRFEQVPIIDDNGKVVGIHLLHDILGKKNRTNWAVVMAGGKGTRLRPITETIPKPMIKVAGRPILERIVLHFINYGIKKIFISVNYLSDIIEDHFKDGSRFGCSIEYLREEKSLGTGGALSLLPEVPKDPIILMNGDLITEIDFDQMISFHEKHQFYATMGVSSYAHEVPYGCVKVQRDRIMELKEKPILQEIINAGVYIISPEALEAVPKNAYFPVTDLFEKALGKKLACGAFKVAKNWIDVGQPNELIKARFGSN